VGFAAHIVALGIVFIVLSVLCASAWVYLISSGVGESKRQVDGIVREATADQQRGSGG
jgi:Na+-transporting methylmalonyl-CoA/oxaloacetate decarboxylase gamma subunit